MLITQISQRAPSTLKFPILFACSSSHPILSRLQVVAAVAVVVVIVFPDHANSQHLDGAKKYCRDLILQLGTWNLDALLILLNFHNSCIIRSNSPVCTMHVHACFYSEHVILVGVLKHLVDRDHPCFISSIVCVAFAGLTCSLIRSFCAVSTIYTI